MRLNQHFLPEYSLIAASYLSEFSQPDKKYPILGQATTNY
jgi:hypothetical protein